MALEGNAKDFGLSEILQLIALQKKSGMLSVTGEDSIVIFFKEGEIISTRDRRKRARDPLKDYLLRYGFISRDEMNRIQHIQEETNLDLTDILLSEKFFSQDELKLIFADQIQETIQKVLGWPRSYYKFITGKNVLQGIRTFVSLKVEGLLMESMRRIDEFPELQRIFPSEETIVKRNPIPENGRIELEDNEEIIYELLEREMTISELVSRARMARFCTYEALRNLLEKGLLQIVGEPVQEDEEEIEYVKKSSTGRKGVFAPVVLSVSILLASFAIGEYVVPLTMPPGWKPYSARGEVSASSLDPSAITLESLKRRRLAAKIENALEEYFALKGSYPFTLEVLVVRELVPKSVIDRAQEAGFVYKARPDGKAYILKRG